MFGLPGDGINGLMEALREASCKGHCGLRGEGTGRYDHCPNEA